MTTVIDGAALKTVERDGAVVWCARAGCKLARYARRARCPRCGETAVIARPEQARAGAAAVPESDAPMGRAERLRRLAVRLRADAVERPQAMLFGAELPSLDEAMEMILLEAVARTGSVLEASRLLRIGKTTVYRWLRRAERRQGFPLRLAESAS